MKWIEKAKALPVKEVLPYELVSAEAAKLYWETASDLSALQPVAVPLPEPKDIPVKLALDALTAQGIMIKEVNQSASYSYDGLEFDLSMTIQIMPDTGKQTLASLNEWFFESKGW